MIECKLRKKKIAPERKDTARDGWIETMRVVLDGRDKANEVDWTLTLKYNGEKLPSAYEKVIGKGDFDEVIATLGTGIQQGRLA
jgi:hypothetical protein